MTTIFLFAFVLYLLGALFIGWRAGNRDDRIAVLAVCIAALASFLANATLSLSAALATVAFIDLTLLAFIVRFACRSERYWPIWFAGIQFVICLTAFAAVVVPLELLRLDLIGGFWAVVALTFMALGLVKDRRPGLKQ